MSSRIADRIRVETVDTPRGAPTWSIDKVRASIAQAQLVNIDAIAEYCFRGIKPGDNYRLADYPNVAPPFETAWFEYRRPALPGMASFAQVDEHIRRHGAGMVAFTELAIPERVGCLVSSQRTDAGWFSYLGFFFADPVMQRLQGPMMCALECDADGAVTSYSLVMDPDATEGDRAATFAAIANLEIPILMATSLLHAKNVTLESEGPVPPKLAKAYARRHNGVQRVRFTQLHIEPMRRVIRNPDGSEPQNPTEMKKALHVVRGHFKDYRDGRGLFGRVRGLYWWDQQARGTIDAGAVEKEYVVHRPSRGAA